MRALLAEAPLGEAPPAPALAPTPAEATLLRFITCGSVDDGKSTLIGRLLFEAGAVPDDQLAALDRDSRKFGATGGRDYALLVDGLSAEREQGITIDVAYRYFATPRRAFIVADTPGHEQYTRNMATGASTADCAVILVDASKGVLEQTRRHSLIASMLGVRRIVVAINKMDLVDFDEARFDAIRRDYEALAAGLGFAEVVCLPLAARDGDNVARRSARMPWHRGPTLLELLETMVVRRDESAAFRFVVQWVSRPDANFRGYAGVVASGAAAAGDAVRVLPSGRATRIAEIVSPGAAPARAVEGQTPTLRLADEIDVSRGDVIVAVGDAVWPRRRVVAHLLWTDETPLRLGQDYYFKLGAAEASARVERLHHAVDISTFAPSPATVLALNGVALVSIALDRPLVAAEYRDSRLLGGFILIDRATMQTVAFGFVDSQADTRALDGPSAPAGGALRRASGLLARWRGPGVERPLRSLARAATWRLAGSIGTYLLVWLFTRSAGLAAAIAATEATVKLALHYAHERVWARIRVGLVAGAPRSDSTDGGGI